MREFFTVISGLISGGCLFIIALRAGLPFFGSVVSQEAKKKLDPIDKLLALTALIFFVVCMSLVLFSF